MFAGIVWACMCVHVLCAWEGMWGRHCAPLLSNSLCAHITYCMVHDWTVTSTESTTSHQQRQVPQHQQYYEEVFPEHTKSTARAHTAGCRELPLHSEPTGAQADHSERPTGTCVSEYVTRSSLLSIPALSPEHQGPQAEDMVQTLCCL